MAEISLNIDGELELSVIKVMGTPVKGQLKDFMAGYYRKGPTRLIFMDFSEGHWPRVAMDAYIQASRNARDFSRPRGKTAFLFSNQSDFGIGRLLETYFGLSDCETELNCFMDESKAREWLLNEDQ